MRSWPDSLVVKQTTHDRSCLSLLKLQTKLYGFRIFASHVNAKEKQTKTLNSYCLRLCKIVYFVSFNCKPINKIGNEEIIIEWEQSNEQGRLVKTEQVNPFEWQYGAKFRNLLYIYIHRHSRPVFPFMDIRASRSGTPNRCMFKFAHF